MALGKTAVKELIDSGCTKNEFIFILISLFIYPFSFP